MSADILAEWHKRQGYKVIRTESSYWVVVTAGVLQAFPYHWVIEPLEAELDHLLVSSQALGLRFSAPLSFRNGSTSYHIIYDDLEYKLTMLTKKARYDVRKGLEAFSIQEISFDRMAEDGWDLRKETLVRQGREGAESSTWWEKLCRSADGLPGIEAWAAIINNRLAASLIAITCDDTCSILYQQSRTEFLKEGVNNALTFKFTHEAMRRRDIKKIFYGLQSLDAPVSVDEYKIRMGYKTQPVRQCVRFHPSISPLFNSVSYSLLKKMHRIYRHSTALAKAEGMLRIYLEGKKPIREQTWPEPLVAQRDALLKTMID